MVLVLLGTQNNSFHRLLEEIQRNIENGNIKDSVIVQEGYNTWWGWFNYNFNRTRQKGDCCS